MNHIAIFGANGSLGVALTPFLHRLGYKLLNIDQKGDVDYKLDATREEEVSRFFDTLINQQILISGVINLVGLIHNRPFYNIMSKPRYLGSTEWTDQFRVNLDSAFFMAKHYHRYCLKQKIKCNMVNVSSVAAQGNPGQIAYSSSKAALEAMTLTLAKELGSTGHRFNVIAPGFIDVASTKTAVTPERIKQIESQTPLRSLGDVDSIANGMHFLLSSNFVTGHILKVDGGIRI